MKDPKLLDSSLLFTYDFEYSALSNFSSFAIVWDNIRFDTALAVWGWEKFRNPTIGKADNVRAYIRRDIREANSAHEVHRIMAVEHKHRHPFWDDNKYDVLKKILRAKIDQHPFIQRLLIHSNTTIIDRINYKEDGLDELWMSVRKDYLKEINDK